MNVLWHKVYADLFKQHRTRTLLALVSLTMGLFTMGTLFGMVDLQLSTMDEAHRRTQPSHVNLILQMPVDESVVSQLAALPDVAAIEALNQLSVRYRVGEGASWRLGTLVVRRDYTHQVYDRVTLLAGDWPANGQLAVENLSAAATGLGIGSSVSLNLPGGPRDFEIGGVIRHPFVKPPAFGGQAHLFAESATLAQFGIPSGRYQQLLVRVGDPYTPERAREVANQFKRVLNEKGIGVNAALLPDPDHHWGRPFVAGIDDVLRVMALAALALSALLIFNTFSALIGQEIEQIGVMKAMGGSFKHVARIYLTEALLLGLAALAVALPASLLAAWFCSRWLLALFNIDLAAFRFSGLAVGLVTGCALVLPVTAALWPVARGASVSVREALSNFGVVSRFGQRLGDRLIAQLADSLLPTLYASALTQLFQHKRRWLLTQGVLVITGICFLLTLSLASSLRQTLDTELGRTHYDVRIGLAGGVPNGLVARAIADVAGITENSGWLRSPITVARQRQALKIQGSLGAQLVGVPADSDFYQPKILEGRWLQPSDAAEQVLVLNADTASSNGIQVGDELSLALPGHTESGWRVIGLYRWLIGNGYGVEPIYAPLESVRQASGHTNAWSMLLVRGDKLADAEAEAQFADTIKAALEQSGLKLDYYAASSRLADNQHLTNQFRPVILMLLGVAAMMAAVGAVGLSGALSIAVMQRRREIGMLRAIGASSSTVFRWFVLEGLFQALLSWLLSVPLAWLVAEPASQRLGRIMFGLALDHAFDLWPVWLWLGLVLLIAALASIGPARGATRVTVRESLAAN